MQSQHVFTAKECPVARVLEVIGDKWSMMIIRDAFDGICRFNEFQKNLGLAKNILAARLRVLVELNIFSLQPASDGSAYKEYKITSKGYELFPVLISIRQWGERYLFDEGETYSVLTDQSGQPLKKIEVRAADGRVMRAEDCHKKRVKKSYFS